MLVQATSLRVAGYAVAQNGTGTATAGVQALAVDVEACGKRQEAGKMQLAMTRALQMHSGCSEKEAALLALQIMSEVIKDESAMFLSLGWRARGISTFGALDARLDVTG